ADCACDLRLAAPVFRNLGRRLRRDLLRRRDEDDVPDLRLGRGAGGDAAADQRDRDGDLRHRSHDDARQRLPAGPARQARLMATASVEPRLPSWWLEDALAREGDPAAAPSLAGDATADVAIVGGGYTGLWTALALREREPELRITLLEAEICGYGPSGRNGGFCHGYWASIGGLVPL